MPFITLNFRRAKSTLVACRSKFRYFNCFNKQALVFAAAIVLGLLCRLPAYAQIDYSFGRNNSGLRLGAGGGITRLNTHYNNNPWIACFIGTLDYEFNPYFSMGVEGQIGTLQGIDNSNPGIQYFHSSTNDYMSASFNMKFGLGLVSDFYPQNKFQDAVKRLYIGIGGGLMRNNIGFTYDKSITDVYFDPRPWGYVTIVPISIGTLIDIGNVFGYDRLEINPNIQCTYINSAYADGFRSSADSNTKGFYNMLSLTVKLKL